MQGHVVLCGLEGLGLRTLEELVRLGERVVVVAAAPEPRFLQPARAIADRVIDGDPRDSDVLRSANVEAAGAIVFTADDDMSNLDAAFAASELAPRVRIVIRIFEPEFGRRIESLFSDCTALGASRLAAPGFVASALHEDGEHPVEIAGRPFMVRAADVGAPGVVMPLARLAEDGTLTPFPSAGEHVLCLLEADPKEAEARQREVHRRLEAGTDVATGFLGWLRRTDRRLRYTAVALVVLMLLSAIVFSLTKHIDLVDGVFNVTKALFGGVDESVADTSELKVFSIFLTLLGAAMIATLFTLLADAVLSARLARVLESSPRRLKGHVVVCGLGTIGYRIVDILRSQGFQVVVAELRADGRFVARARRLGALVITVDSRTDEALEAMNVTDARCLIVATNSDLANLETAVHARALAPDLRIVVRLFDPQRAARLEHAFGGYVSRSVSTLAAPAFAAAAVGRQVLVSIPVGPRVLVVARLPVGAGSSADGSTILDEEASTESRVLAVETGGTRLWRPTPATPIAAGDRLLVVATRQGVAQATHRTDSPGATSRTT